MLISCRSALLLGRIEHDEAEARAMEVEAGTAAGSQMTFVMSCEGTAIAIMRAALMPVENATFGLLIGTQCDPALSLSSVGAPLISAAQEELRQRGAERLMAVAPLPGLCQWVVAQEAWTRIDRSAPGFDDEQVGAVEAVARGVPRPGHSVLGVGTFKAARPAFERLAFEYAMQTRTDADAEHAMFAAAGAELAGINWMHNPEPEALRDCAGCTASLRFPL